MYVLIDLVYNNQARTNFAKSVYDTACNVIVSNKCAEFLQIFFKILHMFSAMDSLNS